MILLELVFMPITIHVSASLEHKKCISLYLICQKKSKNILAYFCVRSRLYFHTLMSRLMLMNRTDTFKILILLGIEIERLNFEIPKKQ